MVAGGTPLAASRVVTLLFVVIVVVGLGLVLFLGYYGGALLSRPKPQPPIARVEYLQLPTLPSIPPPPIRVARGTTPQPLSHDSSSQAFLVEHPSPIPDVISNRDDATERMAMPDDRFSIRKSSPPKH